VQHFFEWLREYNSGYESREAVSFSSLDLYSLGTSVKAVIDYLDHIDPDMAEVARERYGRLILSADEPQMYGLQASLNRLKGYEEKVVQMLQDLLRKRLEYAVAHCDGQEFHSSEQNARLVVGEPSINPFGIIT
jgi:erythromycin esterase-like protein